MSDYNPFKDLGFWRLMNSRQYNIELVLYEINETWIAKNIKHNNGECIPDFEWNPYVIDKNGNKVFYQRELEWSLKDKQSLLTSIYNLRNIGQFIVRKRDIKVVEQSDDLCFKDIVDGKQRLHTLVEFVNDEFPDSNGMYWKDFSHNARNKFLKFGGFAFTFIAEEALDKDIIDIFLNVNITGIPVSESHINKVKQIQF